MPRLEHLSDRMTLKLRALEQPDWARNPLGFWCSAGQWERMEAGLNVFVGRDLLYRWRCRLVTNISFRARPHKC